MILLVFLFILIILLLVYLYIKRKGTARDRDILLLSASQSGTLEKINEIRESTVKAAANVIPGEVVVEMEDGSVLDVEVTIDPDTIEKEQKKCAFKTLVPGKCPNKFSIDGYGCCELMPGANPEASDVAISITKMLAREILIGELAEYAVTKAAPKLIIQTGKLLAGPYGKLLITRLQREAVEFAGEQGARAASILVSRAVSKAVVKGSTTLATRVGVKMAAFGIKTLTKLTSGPVGAAMMAFDVGSLLLDLFDPAGYELFVKNSENSKVRRQLEYMMQKSTGAEGYPMLFPVAMIYKEAWEAAYESVSNDYDAEVINNLTDSDTDQYVDLMIKSLLDEDDSGENLSEFMSNKKEFLMNKDPTSRDRKIINKLFDILPREVHANLQLYESLSSPTHSGISLSKTGAFAWNQMNYTKWMNRDPKTKGKAAPLVAVYSKKYRVVNMVNPGDAGDPNMIEKELPQAAPYVMPWQILYTLCEKPRRGGLTSSTETSINPKSYGVKFDPNNGRCVFTPKYCKHFGLDYDGDGETECELYPGQDVAESIFGKTVTRSFVKVGNAFASIFS
jgi:hypothetical protein